MNGLPGQTLELSYKVPLVGDSSVGKTSIVSRFNDKRYTDNIQTTVGVSNVQLSINVDNQKVDMAIWDTAGQEKFLSLVPLYTRHSDCLIIVFDMSNSTSFNGVEAWYQRTREELDLKCPVVLCGNKIDLPTSVDKEEVELWAESHDCSLCFTSAKDGTGIDQLFQTVGKLLLNKKSTVSEEFGSCPNLEAAQKKKGCC